MMEQMEKIKVLNEGAAKVASEKKRGDKSMTIGGDLSMNSMMSSETAKPVAKIIKFQK